MRRAWLAVPLLLLPGLAAAQTWQPTKCGAEPPAPAMTLTTRDGYTASLAKAETWRRAAAAYAACTLATAHDDEAAISQAAQDRIAAIQAAAVARQQAIYARIAAQSETFRQAAHALDGK